ncbi:hypothetical protein [Rhodopirellula sallentina]|uniref:Uncharacterized protein n=1 Tax=Rhodopirellula sallentina SM41 TaxID=1263870 RepID=M5U7V7_9BACT|nr:hypothetical protein [Rhodopirellula sallentina]EMI57547.1 hypothetical protein RSSM_01013 [Rhodopirellula sallentina SM41]
MREGCHILFRSPGITIEEAAELLDRTGTTIDFTDDGFTLATQNGPSLRIFRRNGTTVLRDAIRLGDNTVYQDFLESCDCRFELVFDALSAVRNDANTLIETQLALQTATNGLVFTTWNREMSHPDIKGPKPKQRLMMAGRPTPTHDDYTADDAIPCPECGKQLRTSKAKQCFHCGASWH